MTALHIYMFCDTRYFIEDMYGYCVEHIHNSYLLNIPSEPFGACCVIIISYS